MEELYHYLWKYKMMGRTLLLNSGQRAEIIDPGIHNHDSGPDFFNAKIKIDGQLWAGNVEIHVKASDWHRHGHDHDPAYNDIILHAVSIDDATIYRSDGTPIPQAVLTMPESFFLTLSHLENGFESVRCAGKLHTLSPIQISDWVETLGVIRLQAKAQRVADTLKATGGDWESTCFITLARALGFGLNAQPFEMLARSLPIKFAARHSDNLFQLEALLFGQAGMLDSSVHILDEYYQSLCREYYFLARKYNLRPLRPDIWKYARTRPQNFPHRRIAMLAKALEGGFTMLSRLIDTDGKRENIYPLFDWKLTGYWHDNSGFGLPAKTPSDALGRSSADLLLINFAAPMIYSYHCIHGDSEKAEKACDLLCDIKPESNTYVTHWSTLGLKCADAFQSQALLHLRKEYCDTRKCRDCRFGHLLLRKAANE